MIVISINNEPGDCVKERHICYFTRDEGAVIALMEVVESFYRHPQAPEDAILPVIEMKCVKQCHRHTYEAGVLVLLEANENAVSLQQEAFYGPRPTGRQRARQHEH